MMASPTALCEHQAALAELLSEFDRVCQALDIPYVLFAGTMLGAVRHHGFIPWDDDLDVLMLRCDYDRLLREADGVLNGERFFLQKEFSEHWPMFFSKLRLNGTTCLETYHPKDTASHFGVYIDIFPCDNAANGRFGRRMQYLASKAVIAQSLYKRGYETNSLVKKLFMQACRLLPAGWLRRAVKGGRKDSRTVHTFFAAAASYRKNVYPREWFTARITVPFGEGEYPIPAEYDRVLTHIYGAYMTLPPPEQRRVKRHAVLVDLHNGYECYRTYHREMTFDVLTESIR